MQRFGTLKTSTNELPGPGKSACSSRPLPFLSEPERSFFRGLDQASRREQLRARESSKSTTFHSQGASFMSDHVAKPAYSAHDRKLDELVTKILSLPKEDRDEVIGTVLLIDKVQAVGHMLPEDV